MVIDMTSATSPGTSTHTSFVSLEDKPWHTFSLEESLELCKSQPDVGLTPEEVSARLEQYGNNELVETGGRSTLTILLDQFTNVMLLMLIAVAIISGILDLQGQNFPKDAIAILAIVILNGILGYLQESRAEKALAALKNMASPLVRVLRQGQLQEVKSPDLVPGDIMLLEAGSQVAADGRLLEAVNLEIREAALTGEAHAVSKNANIILSESTALGDRVNLVFQGTEVVRGRGKVLVTNTGMTTELGKIATLLQSVETEPTPLQQRMTQLGNVLVTGSLILVAIVVIGGVIASGWEEFNHLLEISLSMAVAVVPEGLPAVITVTLALGTQRMVKRHALIRKLPAVETLGSVTTICSDKTGTLTQNKMVVQWGITASHTIWITGHGYNPTGQFMAAELLRSETDMKAQQFSSHSAAATEEIDWLQEPEWCRLLLGCVICNDASLQLDEKDLSLSETKEWKIVGDPTEGALLSLAGKGGIYKDAISTDFPRIAEVPFSSERKRMSVICQEKTDQSIFSQGELILFTKGSPELTLNCCTQIQQGQEVKPLTPDLIHHILEQNNQMAIHGLRVLGFAYKPIPSVNPDQITEDIESELIWLGLVGMLDAPRPEVRDAVEKCRRAGIRPIMITGDHQLTAQAIAHDLGIAKKGDLVLSGQELEKMSQEELEQKVDQASVYARVSPEHKLRIVQALQSAGKFVAMTGDGVNDAPALKQADIGIAMGITGTDVSKEASDMVLLDDNFTTIVAATEEGRVVYTNIRRFIKYILGSNIGEVLTIAAAPVFGLPDVPLTPLQILWMNLVTDGVPALALAVEPAEPNVMQRPPYSPRENIFARGLGFYMVRIGIVFAIQTIALMLWAYHDAQASGDPSRWKTMVFTTLCLAQMGHAIAVRSNTQLTLELSPFSNLFVWGAVIMTTVLQLMLVYVAPLRNFFGTQVLSPQELLICLGFSLGLFVWVELEKVSARFLQLPFRKNRTRE